MLHTRFSRPEGWRCLSLGLERLFSLTIKNVCVSLVQQPAQAALQQFGNFLTLKLAFCSVVCCQMYTGGKFNQPAAQLFLFW